MNERLELFERVGCLLGAMSLLFSCLGIDTNPRKQTREFVEALLGGTSMEDTPWPSDIFLKDGHVDVKSIPLDGGQRPLELLALAISEMDGAPVYGSVFFPVRGEIDDGPVPGKARWIDLDEPDRSFETELWARAETGEVVALAPSGEVLSAGHRYAVVIESPSVGPSAGMRDALNGRGPFASAYSGFPGYGLGDEFAVTVFTVGHPTRMVERMREVAAARSAPVARVTRVLRGEALEEFTGVPTTTRPGLGDPAGILHDALDAILLGEFDAPSFLSAAPPAFGRTEVDNAGAPIVKGTEAIPFMLTLPKREEADWTALPILIFQHGLNAGRSQVLTCANSYARAGYATIGVDALWHGDRAPVKPDAVHNFTGAAGPDGLADANDFGAAAYLFNFGGDPTQGIEPFDGRYVRDNFRQAIVDLTELARLLRHGDLNAIAASDPAFAGVAFDTETIVYTSESFGSVLGGSVIAASPHLAGAVLSVAGGGIFLPMYPNSPLFAGLLTPLIRATFDGLLDVSDPSVLPAEAQRSLSLLNAVISPGDPLSFAPLISERMKNVLILQARSDELIPNQATELLARAMGATAVTLPDSTRPLRFVEIPTVSAPYEAESGGGTIAVVQIGPALHTMFSSFTGESRYDPDFPPFFALPQPMRVDNPIELVHELAIAFVESLRAGGPGRVESLSR